MGYPYPYIGHGIAAARKHMEVFVCFRDSVSKADREAIEAEAPAPLNEAFTWASKVLIFGHDSDSLQWVVKGIYGDVEDPDDAFLDDPEMPSRAQWIAFNADIDRFIKWLHGRYPVAFVIKPIDEEYSSQTDAWHDWSVERIPFDVLTKKSAVGKKHDDTLQYAAEVWQDEMLNSPVERQHELLDALGKRAQKALKTRGCLPKVTKKPPKPAPSTFEEEREVLTRLLEERGESCRGFPRIEEAFEDALAPKPGQPLLHHLIDAKKAGPLDESIEHARRIIALGVKFPSHWWEFLLELCIEAGDLDSAADVLPEVVARIDSYSPDRLVTVMDYYAAVGDLDTEATLFHAGCDLVTGFASEITKTRAKKYGNEPDDQKERFAAWLRGFIEAQDLEKCDSIGHWLVWIDKTNAPAGAFGDVVSRLEAERARRVELRNRLANATGDDVVAATDAFVESPEEISGSTYEAALRFHESHPEQAYRLYKHSLERFDGYKHQSFLDYAQHLLGLAVDKLPERLGEALELATPWASQHPFLFHKAAAVAMRDGGRDEAYRYIREAVRHSYDYLQALYDDPAFESVRGTREFDDLFGSSIDLV